MKLASLGELFADTTVAVSVKGHMSGLNSHAIKKKLPGPMSASEIEEKMAPDQSYRQIEFDVALRGFTRSGTRPFNVEGKFGWQFDEMKYSLTVGIAGRAAKLERIYNEEIPRDELNKAMDAFCSFFVDEVRKRANDKGQE